MSGLKEEQGTFQSFDGLKLFYRYYSAGPSTPLLILLHGHGEHSGRYEKFAQILADEKISIASFDFRGNGRSEGREVHVNYFEEYLEDVSSFIASLKQRYQVPEKVTFLGHSLGGLVAVHWARRFPEKLEGLILSSPCLGLILPGFLKVFNSFLNEWVPRLSYRNPVYPPHLSHHPEEVALYRNDPFIKRKMTVRLLHEMLRYMTRLDHLDVIRYPFPVYILMAELEKVVDPFRTKAFFDKVQAPAKKMIVFPGFYHEIFNERDQEKVFNSLKECLREIQQKRASA